MSDYFGDVGGEEPLQKPKISDSYRDISEVPEIPEIPEIAEIPEIPDIPEELDILDSPQVTEDSEIQQAVDRLENIENLDPGIWDSLDHDERLETLQTIENEMAETQGRPPVTVIADDTLGSSTFGGYDPVSDTITINSAHLNSDMAVDEFIDTMVHEGRHAYQEYAIRNPGFVENIDLVNSWAENQQNYLKPAEYGQEIYENQPLEADAWGYATHIRNTLIANNWRKYYEGE